MYAAGTATLHLVAVLWYYVFVVGSSCNHTWDYVMCDESLRNIEPACSHSGSHWLVQFTGSCSSQFSGSLVRAVHWFVQLTGSCSSLVHWFTGSYSSLVHAVHWFMQFTGSCSSLVRTVHWFV